MYRLDIYSDRPYKGDAWIMASLGEKPDRLERLAQERIAEYETRQDMARFTFAWEVRPWS